jgi:hypothetical protein
MSRLWRQKKEMNQRVRQAWEQLAIVHESILAIDEALRTSHSDPQQGLALTTRLDALLRRQDRLQRFQAPQKQAVEPPATDFDLAAELLGLGSDLRGRPGRGADCNAAGSSGIPIAAINDVMWLTHPEHSAS